MYCLSDICFMCLNKNNLQKVFQDNLQNNTVEQVTYVLPEISTFLESSKTSIHICSTCQITMNSFYTFKKMCLKNYIHLTNYIKMLQGPNECQVQSELQIKIINNNPNEVFIKQEIDMDTNDIDIKQFEQCYLQGSNQPILYVKTEVPDQIQDGDSNFCSTVELETKTNLTNPNEVIVKQEQEEEIVISTKEDPILYVKTEVPDQIQDGGSDFCSTVELETKTNWTNPNEVLVKQEQEDEIVISTIEDPLVSLPKEEEEEEEENEEELCEVSDEVQDASSSTDEDEAKMKKDILTNPDSVCEKYLTKKDDDGKAFKCKLCSKKIVTKSKLLKHVQKHLDVLNYTCPICDKKFLLNFDLKIHLKSHLNEKFDCSMCDRKFRTKTHLRMHINTHRGIRNFECDICKKKFIYNGSLTKHMKIIHEAKRTQLKCKVCTKSFYDMKMFNKHLEDLDCKKVEDKIKASTELKPVLKILDFECEMCKKRFILQHSLQRHMKLHLDLENIECNICNKKFIQKTDLEIHMKSHAKAKQGEQ